MESRPVNELSVETLPSMAHIFALQRAMEHSPFRAKAPEAYHHFANGVYIRSMTIPPGMTIVGKVHRHEHIIIVAKGRIRIVSEGSAGEYSAGYVGISPPWTKRAVHALEETVVINVHYNPTNTQDLAAIEAEHIVPEHEALEQLAAQQALESAP